MPLEAIKDSNAQDGGSAPDAVPSEGGYTTQARPSAGPAMSWSDLSGYSNDNASLGQEGTNCYSYHQQPKTVEAKTGPKSDK